MSDTEREVAAEEPAPEDTRERLPARERELVHRLAFASLIEQRRARRWGVFFKLVVLAYLLVILLLYAPIDGFELGGAGAKHVALVDVEGVIAEGTSTSADRVVTGLRAAFEDDDTAGVIVRINSPGGSPVQAAYINQEMRRLRDEHPEVPLYAVITDICASGGYYVAVAADEIYANESSIVGSIGVLMNGFGFVEGMKKLGVERRLYTAGENKDFLDPFSPVEPEQRAHLQRMLDRIHAQFIQAVKEGRGDRLAEDDRLFSGLMWTGKRGLELGLVDAMGSAGYVAREVIGVDNIVDFTPRGSLVERLSERFGAAVARALSLERAASGLELR